MKSTGKRPGHYCHLNSGAVLIHRPTFWTLIDILIGKGPHAIGQFRVGANASRGDIYFTAPAMVFIFNFVVYDPVG